VAINEGVAHGELHGVALVLVEDRLRPTVHIDVDHESSQLMAAALSSVGVLGCADCPAISSYFVEASLGSMLS
jgi:Uri superfamily endonuclease